MEPEADEAAEPFVAPPEPSAGRGRLAAWFGAVTVLLVVAVIAAVLVGGSANDPEEDLQAVVAFVNEHKTAHVTIETISETSSGDEGVGSDTTERARSVGVIELPHRSRTIDHSEFGVSETIVVEDGSYYRWADEHEEDLARQPWLYARDEDALEDAELAVGELTPPGLAEAMAAAGNASAALGAPSALVEQLRDLKDVERVSSDSIRGRIDWRTLLPAELVNELPSGVRIDVTAQITMGAGSSLDRLRVVSAMEPTPAEVADADDDDSFLFERMTETIDIRFTRWGEPVDITVPSRDQLDVTPDIEEEDLVAFDSFPVFVPAEVPAGWKVSSAYVEENDDELETCESVTIAWSDPYAPEDAYPLDVTAFSSRADCKWAGADSMDIESERPVNVGGRAGTLRVHEAYPGEDHPLYRDVVVVIDGVRVEIGSDVPEADLLRYAATLVRLDVSKLDIERSEPKP